jgi:HEAT repeat protein
VLLKYDSDPEVQRSTIEALGKFRDDRVFDALAEHIGRGGSSQQFAEERFKSLAEMTATQKVKKERLGSTFEQLVNKPAATALLTAIDGATKDSKWRIITLMGNFDDERITMRLTKLLDDSSPYIRKTAVNSLGRNINADLVPLVLIKLKDEDPQVRKEAAAVLGYSRDRRVLEPLLELFNDKNTDVRTEAINATRYLNDKNTIEPLMKMLKDDNASVRSSALRALKDYDDRRISDVSIEMLKDKDRYVRYNAISNIQKRPDARAVDLLIPLLNDPDWWVAPPAAEALGIIGDNRAVEPLIKALYGDSNTNRMFNGDYDLRQAALKALIKLDKNKAMPALTKVALNQNDDSRLRYAAATAIMEIDGPSGADIIKSLPYEEKFDGKMQLIEAISKVNVDAAIAILINYLNTDDKVRIDSAVHLLGRLKSEAAIKPLVKTAGRKMIYPIAVTNALKEYRKPDMSEILMSYLRDDDLLVKKGSIILLGEFRERKAIESLKPFLEDKDPEIRTLAKDAISKLESTSAPAPRIMNTPRPMSIMR